MNIYVALQLFSSFEATNQKQEKSKRTTKLVFVLFRGEWTRGKLMLSWQQNVQMLHIK